MICDRSKDLTLKAVRSIFKGQFLTKASYYSLANTPLSSIWQPSHVFMCISSKSLAGYRNQTVMTHGLPVRYFASLHTRLSPARPRPEATSTNTKSGFKFPSSKYIVASLIFYGIAIYVGYEYFGPTFIKQYSDTEKPKNPVAMESVDTTPVYEKLARDYDSKIWIEELVAHIWWFRRKLAKNAKGDVLEVSCGTGRNIAYLPMSNITSITFLDSSEEMLQITLEKFQKKFPTMSNVQFVKAKAEDLANVDTSGQKFDTIMESFGLCSHEDPYLVLKNMRQLLKPNGKIVLLEHGRSTSETTNLRMDKNADKRFEEWGCRYNLDIDSIVRSTGLEVIESGRYQFGTTYFYILKEPGSQ